MNNTNRIEAEYSFWKWYFKYGARYDRYGDEEQTTDKTGFYR